MDQDEKTADLFLVSLCRALRLRREQLGMSQEDLASRSGLHRTYISDVERGARNLSIKSLSQLASALATSVTEIIAAAEAEQAVLANPLEVLLVEDNPTDVHLIEMAIKESRVSCRVTTVKDGVEALSYLNGLGKSNGAIRPQIVLLDLNLPRKSGFEVLSEIKSNKELLDIPVIVLTSSNSHQDMMRTYRMHANCFITKPVDPEEFFRVVGQTLKFWSAVVKRPLPSPWL